LLRTSSLSSFTKVENCGQLRAFAIGQLPREWQTLDAQLAWRAAGSLNELPGNDFIEWVGNRLGRLLLGGAPTRFGAIALLLLILMLTVSPLALRGLADFLF